MHFPFSFHNNSASECLLVMWKKFPLQRTVGRKFQFTPVVVDYATGFPKRGWIFKLLNMSLCWRKRSIAVKNVLKILCDKVVDLVMSQLCVLSRDEHLWAFQIQDKLATQINFWIWISTSRTFFFGKQYTRNSYWKFKDASKLCNICMSSYWKPSKEVWFNKFVWFVV